MGGKTMAETYIPEGYTLQDVLDSNPTRIKYIEPDIAFALREKYMDICQERELPAPACYHRKEVDANTPMVDALGDLDITEYTQPEHIEDTRKDTPTSSASVEATSRSLVEHLIKIHIEDPELLEESLVTYNLILEKFSEMRSQSTFDYLLKMCDGDTYKIFNMLVEEICGEELL
jgi:hypothetical protein